MKHHIRLVSVFAALLLGGTALSACSSSSSDTTVATASVATAAPATTESGAPAATATTETAAPAATAATEMTTAIEGAKWASNVTVTITDGTFRFVSDGVPNHERQAEYALPSGGGGVPNASTATAEADPTTSQSYNYSIPTTPTKAASPKASSLGAIGVMISGAVLFNPYEGDGSTAATASNFTVKNAAGKDVAFLDSCNGHPTPEFPNGVFHYVLLDTADSTSSIRCFTGTVDAALTKMSGMGAMPPAGAPQP